MVSAEAGSFARGCERKKRAQRTCALQRQRIASHGGASEGSERKEGVVFVEADSARVRERKKQAQKRCCIQRKQAVSLGCASEGGGRKERALLSRSGQCSGARAKEGSAKKAAHFSGGGHLRSGARAKEASAKNVSSSAEADSFVWVRKRNKRAQRTCALQRKWADSLGYASEGSERKEFAVFSGSGQIHSGARAKAARAKNVLSSAEEGRFARGRERKKRAQRLCALQLRSGVRVKEASAKKKGSLAKVVR